MFRRARGNEPHLLKEPGVRQGRQALLWTAAWLLSLPTFIVPLCNPDLFWHLSAGRWILAHRSWPRADFLSFAAAGRPWADFEWLAQLVFQALYACGGMTSLWLFKAAFLAASWLVIDRALARRGCGPAPRALGLVLWSAGMLSHSDIRPELFSILFFSALIYLGEGGLLETPSPRVLGCVFGIFALWSNLHGAFPAGWFLLLCYAVEAGLRRKRGFSPAPFHALILSVPATLLNPYGTGPWRVILMHSLQRADLSRTIKEWQGLGFDNPVYWPSWVIIGLAAVAIPAALAAAARRRIAREPSWPLAAAALCFGLAALRYERSSVYFAVSAAALLPLLARALKREGCAWARRAAVAAVSAYAAFIVWLVPRIFWAGVFNYKYVARAATGFMARQRPILEPLRLYNQWEWGGYLGWKLEPWYRVFCDGRYIFHGQLAETGRAVTSPEKWSGFMAANGLDGALMLNLDTMLPARKLYPDGRLRDFPRPWYFFYMPRTRWALVYWDDQALLFVDRQAVPRAWLAEHEYRYARPRDEAAFREALRLKEIPAAAAAAEQKRHRRELEEFGAGTP